MIEVFRTTSRGLERVTEITPGCWANAVSPTPDEVAWLQTFLEAPKDFITYPLDPDERARTEREDGATLIVLRVPMVLGPDDDVPYTTVPLGIVMTDGHIATIGRYETGVIQTMASQRVRGLSTAKRNRFVLQLLLLTAQRYQTHLAEINRSVDVLEDRLQRSLRNQEVLELLRHQKSLVYFTTALKANEIVLQRLKRSRLFDAFPDDEDLLEDALTETQQAIEVVGITGSILAGTMDAFASIISNNLNSVMKFLASVTIVLSIPTIMTSAFGMNVGLPSDGHPTSFALIMLVIVLICAVVIVLFWRRDWF
jgi:magnesium transporter